MTFDLVIKEEAHVNIQRNAMWWAINHSPDEAIAWQASIYKQLEQLRTMPERFGLARENDYVPFELRQQLVGTGKNPSYRALFRINGSTVEVLTFQAAEQDDWQPGDL